MILRAGSIVTIVPRITRVDGSGSELIPQGWQI